MPPSVAVPIPIFLGHVAGAAVHALARVEVVVAVVVPAAPVEEHAVIPGVLAVFDVGAVPRRVTRLHPGFTP